jgi:hypothetical protein
MSGNRAAGRMKVERLWHGRRGIFTAENAESAEEDYKGLIFISGIRGQS